MHCDDARACLLGRLDHPATEAGAALVGHLEDCADCRALEDDILAMQSQARVWHELNPPPWNPAPLGAPGTGGDRSASTRWLYLIQQWFPVLASTAALLLAAGIYLQVGEPRTRDTPGGVADGAFLQGDVAQTDPQPREQVSGASASPELPTPTAEALLVASRRERQQEMEALSALLKAEMDRRSLETEQSLKYIISHQIQSQRELEAMRGQLMRTESNGSEQL